LLLAYYGDDFTGSTDAMEVMSAAGLSTVLFCARPMRRCWRASRGALHRHRGSSRGRSPQWMDEHLGAPLPRWPRCVRR
jgi:uncharacterized protein YgbK (DUF1537 family)